MITEGVFRIADTLQWGVPVFLTCELTSRFIGLSIMDEVLFNFQNPYRILLNLVKNEFNLLSDFLVLISDVFYKDNFSLCFWVGDLLYNIVVMQPVDYDVSTLFQNDDPNYLFNFEK